MTSKMSMVFRADRELLILDLEDEWEFYKPLDQILSSRINITPAVFHQGGRLPQIDNMDNMEPAESPSPTPTSLPLSQSINTNATVNFPRSQIQSPNSAPAVRPPHALEYPISASAVPPPPLHRPPIHQSPSLFSTSSDVLPDPADIEDFTAVLFNRPRPPRPDLPRPDSRPVQSWQGPPATFVHQFRGDPVVNSTITAVMPANDVRPALKPYTSKSDWCC